MLRETFKVLIILVGVVSGTLETANPIFTGDVSAPIFVAACGNFG
jgi:hypothetical protein